MGSFSDISIGKYTGFELKNSYFQDIVNLIFTKNDYLEYSTIVDEENRINKVLETTVEICVKRLEIYGANLNRAKENFNQAVSNEFSEGLIDRIISFEEYLEFVSTGINNFEDSYSRSDDFLMGTIENSLLISDFYLEGQSTVLWLYTLLKSVKKDSPLRYNLTEMIDSGYVPENFYEDIRNEKIIIITEGKTDSIFIKESLNLLFPEISDYYHFMDFELVNYGGGASLLVHSIKSFIGSNIENLMIGLFDNDTAGKKEINNLKKISLPKNIKALQYPNIELAKNYPTYGPTGMQNLDINGKAGSIELYLGEDVLMKDGQFIPIQWKSLDNQLNQYQGEIREKNMCK